MLFIFLAAIDDHRYDNKFEEIYYEYLSLALKVANSILDNEYDAEDAVMDAFFGIARNIKAIDALDQCRLKVYVCVTVRNACINIIRKKRNNAVVCDFFEDVPNNEPSIEEALIDKEYNQELVIAVSKLPAIYRDLLIYKYCIDLSAKSISELLGIPFGTVKSRIRNGLKILRKALDKKEV